MSLDIGQRCSLSSCGTIDFLPILCRCNKHYCRYHALPESHSCPADLSDYPPLTSSGDSIPCSVPDCKRPYATVSNQAQQNNATYCISKPYCIVHRHLSSTPDSSSQGQANIGNARALLAKHFQPRNGPPHKVGRPQMRKNVPQTDHVLLMKMRHNAIPGDSRYTSSASIVKPHERLYLRIQVSPEAESMFWFKKDSITGKVLDLLAATLNIRSSGSPLYLVLLDDASVPPSRQILRNDVLISQQVCDNALLMVGS